MQARFEHKLLSPEVAVKFLIKRLQTLLQYQEVVIIGIMDVLEDWVQPHHAIFRAEGRAPMNPKKNPQGKEGKQ